MKAKIYPFEATAKRDFLISLTSDAEVLSVLTIIAESETENNRSAAFRRVVREAGVKRGLLPAPAMPINPTYPHQVFGAIGAIGANHEGG